MPEQPIKSIQRPPGQPGQGQPAQPQIRKLGHKFVNWVVNPRQPVLVHSRRTCRGHRPPSPPWKIRASTC